MSASALFSFRPRKIPHFYGVRVNNTIIANNTVIFLLASKRYFPLFNPLSAKFIKWSNTLKQFVGKLPTNCLTVFDHFVGLVLNGLIRNVNIFQRKKIVLIMIIFHIIFSYFMHSILTFYFIMLKNGQTYFKNLAV